MVRNFGLKRKVIASALALAVLVVPFMPIAAQAAFPNFLISDSELFTGKDLSRTGIQSFLTRQGSGLATAKIATPKGVKKPADIIYDASAAWNISARYLLTLLQKEQSLVTTKNPSNYQLDWATGYAVCDSCSQSDPAVLQYKGFYNQVTWGARRIRETYLPLMEATGRIFGFGPNITTIVDGTAVTPANKATAALYQYTPHLHGNQNFLRLWTTWFARLFPDGTLLKQDGTDNYYLIEFGKKRPFRSVTVLLSNYDPKKALVATSDELGAYDTGQPILFPNYSLIRSPQGGVYLIVDGKRRAIQSKEVFRTLGFNPEEVVKAPWTDLNAYPDGPKLTLDSAYPSGALLRSATNGGVTYVENGVRHVIYAKEILRSRFQNLPTTRVSDEEIAKYPVGDPVLFRDGELITAPGYGIYFISNGQKRPIASQDVFDRLGLKWRNIITTTPKIMELHPTGDPITVGD